MDCLMMSHCLPDCFLYDGLQDYLLGIWGCQKISTWEHKQNLCHHRLFWTFLLCCFPLHNNLELSDFQLDLTFCQWLLCLEMLEQSYQDHGFVYLCWVMLMIWCYTSNHGLLRDQLIWLSLRGSIIFPSPHSLKVFHIFIYWFHSRLHTCLFYCSHYKKIIKK